MYFTFTQTFYVYYSEDIIARARNNAMWRKTVNFGKSGNTNKEKKKEANRLAGKLFIRPSE